MEMLILIVCHNVIHCCTPVPQLQHLLGLNWGKQRKDKGFFILIPTDETHRWSVSTWHSRQTRFTSGTLGQGQNHAWKKKSLNKQLSSTKTVQPLVGPKNKLMLTQLKFGMKQIQNVFSIHFVLGVFYSSPESLHLHYSSLNSTC